LIKVEKHQQERNLLYVAQTRAKRTLTYIYTENFEGDNN
jgi:ATP-dependent exoDNAse (exonuclease V) beta subunit